MKFERRDTNDLELKELTRSLQNVLSNVSLDNMKAQIFEADGVDGEDKVFTHSLGQKPAFWVAIEGDVFVPFGGLTQTKVTVTPRSTGKFKIAFIK